jgi:hypothetical protein
MVMCKSASYGGKMTDTRTQCAKIHALILGPKAHDISGQTFGRLTAICPIERNNLGRALWLCVCDCGTEAKVITANLTAGVTKSCGCIRLEGNARKHGCYETPEHNSWAQMHKRCKAKRGTHKRLYVDRGISICKRWVLFENFHADMGERPKGMTLDRIDNDGDYTPENCRWATARQQANNRINNKKITFCSKTMNLSQWARRYGISPETISCRIKRGWPVEKALTEPVRGRQ